MSTLKNLTEGNSWASWSYTGAIILQGPHLRGQAATTAWREHATSARHAHAQGNSSSEQGDLVHAYTSTLLIWLHGQRLQSGSHEAGGRMQQSEARARHEQAHQTAEKSMMAPPLLAASSLSAA